MVMCKRVVILAVGHSRPLQIEIDLPDPVPTEYVVEYLHSSFCDLLPVVGWVPRARIRNFGCEVHLELFDRVWLLSPKPKEENKK